MKKKKSLIAIVIGLILGSLAFYTTLSLADLHVINNYNVLLEKPTVLESSAKTITLLEAWDITQAFAKEWSEDAALISLASTDVDDPNVKVGQGEHQQSGQDGRRRIWQAVLTSPALDKQLFLQIADGTIVSALEDGIHDIGIPTLVEKPVMDSPELIRQAKDIEPGFGASVGKSKGYRFIFQTGDSGVSVLTVVGSHQVGDEQLPATITFNQETGQFESKHYINNGGTSQWEDF